MKPDEVLLNAREFLAQPEKWTKGAGARSIGGHVVSVASKEAACFCVAGALAHVAGMTRMWSPDDGREVVQAYHAALHVLAVEVRETYPSLPPGDLDAVGQWNDLPSTTLSEVIATLIMAEDAARDQETAAA